MEFTLIVPTIQNNSERIKALERMFEGRIEKKMGGMDAWKEITGLSPATFYQYRCMGRIPVHIYRKVGKFYRFNLKALIEWNEAGRPTPAQMAVSGL